MFMAERDAKCSNPRRIRAGQDVFSQRQTTSSSSRCRRLWQTGQLVGISHGTLFSACGRIALTTFGMTSPPFSISTRSPSRRSFLAMSSALCSVAIEIVEPASNTGSSTAYGVIGPGSTHVDVNLAQSGRGLLRRELEGGRPAREFRRDPQSFPKSEIVHFDHDAVGRKAKSLALLTIHSSQNPATASTPGDARQFGSTGSPHSRIAVSISACVAKEAARRLTIW